MNSIKKIIGLMVMALFCMGSQCQGTFKKDPEHLYQCRLIAGIEAPDPGTWDDEDGNTHQGSWYSYYEVPIKYIGTNSSEHRFRFIESDNNTIRACEDPRPDGRGQCLPQTVAGFADGSQCLSNCIDISISASDDVRPPRLYARNGKIEACRKVKIFHGNMANQKWKGITTIEKYNSKFGDGSSECKLSLISGPPTCGGY